MTNYIYTFSAVFTKNKINTIPSSPPTVNLNDMDFPSGGLIVSGANPSSINGMDGVYVYQYLTTNQGNYVANFHTNDSTVDLQDVVNSSPIVNYINVLILDSDKTDISQRVWNSSYNPDRKLSQNEISTINDSGSSELSQEPGQLNITMVHTDDLSFDIDLSMDLTLYDYEAWILPVGLDRTPISIVITPTDISTGKLHFYISDVSIKDLQVTSNKHRWEFKLSTPKENTLPSNVFTRTILSGYFNLLY